LADLLQYDASNAGFRGNNAFSIDVEDYFQVSAFEPHIDRAEWENLECRVHGNMDRILDLLEQHDAKGTFFFLGWIAERYPDLLKRVANLGHEIASHGYEHIRVCNQTREQFRQDVIRTKNLLEDISGSAIDGYRAASFSIDADNDWARDILAETGHRYSSSIYPIRHDRYGLQHAPRFPCREDSGRGVVELPVTTVELFGNRLPCGGGGYFRLLPYAWTRWAIGRVNAADGQPAIFYFHPWEIDPDQPRTGGLDRLTRFRHYVNLERTGAKLSRLLRDFRWTTVREAFGDAI